jgi:Holliday junction resolvasome RuvABC endonuclease subunit
MIDRGQRMTLWLGIDPGLSGACAFIGDNGESPMVYPLPILETDHGQDELDGDALRDLLESFDPRLVCMELVQGFGGCSSAFKLGQSVGTLVTTILGSRFRLERVRPAKWQSVMLPGVHGRENLKRASVAKAKALFPTCPLVRDGRCKPDDKSDALLIAAYARQEFGP